MLAYCKPCVTYYVEFNSNDEGIEKKKIPTSKTDVQARSISGSQFTN